MASLYVRFALILGPLLVFFALIEWRIRAKDRQNRLSLERASRMGLNVPISLHPYIDPDRCIGSGACVRACPEKNPLGLVAGRGTLIRADACVGHGACAAACPVEAIRLVFGTAQRGVDIPRLSPTFESSVPGLFLAGEVGGMGLIRNAIEQGRQAMMALAQGLTREGDAEFDVIIIGAGPAGISAATHAQTQGLNALLLEQEDPGGSILHYPRGKVVLTKPLSLPGQETLPGPHHTKEQLMDLVETACQALNLRRRARVDDVQAAEGRFVVKLADGGALIARRVLVAVGRRGSPRKLEVPGEDQRKVVYRLIDPAQYQGQRVLVVGGGNSAVEAALMLAEEPGTQVDLSYRGDSFGRVAEETRTRLDQAVTSGKLTLRLKSKVLEITPEAVRLSAPDGPLTLPNDAVLVQAGGTVPTDFLKKIGVLVDVHHGPHVHSA